MKLRTMRWALMLVCAWPLAGQAAPDHATHRVGASVEELLALAGEMNPEQAAAALEADGARTRVELADALPDPRFQVTFDDISKNDRSWPGRGETYKYTLSQELPWWGKRALKREIALADSREALGRREEVNAEVAMKVKVAYADYHRVHLSMDQTDELIQVVRALVEFARFRYAQGLGGQQEATTAEAERGGLSAERVRLEKERHRIRARLNALVNRTPDAQVVEHPTLRPMPSTSVLAFESLLERGLERNPALRMGRARLESAQGNVALAEKNGFPDLEVGFGLVNRRDMDAPDGYEAMVGLNLPIAWGWREAERQAASLDAKAARQKLEAERVRLETGLHETLLSLEEARQVEKVTSDSLLPQARIALQSTLKGYETGTVEAIAVLDAVQRLKRFQIDLIKAQFEQQVRLAEIERFVGGEL